MTGAEPVAVLGAGGTMGFAMAGNLARAGIQVRAWNRSRQKAEPLARDGVRLCDTPRQAADGAAVMLTILSDTDAVMESVAGDEGALASAGEAAIWLQMSTIGEAGTDRCLALAGSRGVTLVDAPVLGTKQPAEQGQLVILASGPEQARERLAPIFDAIGKKTMWIGDAGAGTRLKIAVNSWVLTVVEGGAETIALAEGLGLDPSLIFDALDGGALDLPYLRLKGKAIAERNFDPAFKLALAAKDAGLVVESAARHDLDLPLFALIRDRMSEGATDHGEKDMCATYLTSAPSRTVA
jgi:3-hydroxyisobutyrate dehydrogenase